MYIKFLLDEAMSNTNIIYVDNVYHYQVAQTAWSYLTLSHHPFQSFIARSSRLHSVSAKTRVFAVGQHWHVSVSLERHFFNLSMYTYAYIFGSYTMIGKCIIWIRILLSDSSVLISSPFFSSRFISFCFLANRTFCHSVTLMSLDEEWQHGHNFMYTFCLLFLVSFSFHCPHGQNGE